MLIFIRFKKNEAFQFVTSVLMSALNLLYECILNLSVNSAYDSPVQKLPCLVPICEEGPMSLATSGRSKANFAARKGPKRVILEISRFVVTVASNFNLGVW